MKRMTNEQWEAHLAELATDLGIRITRAENIAARLTNGGADSVLNAQAMKEQRREARYRAFRGRRLVGRLHAWLGGFVGAGRASAAVGASAGGWGG